MRKLVCLPSLHCNEEPECFQGFEWGGFMVGKRWQQCQQAEPKPFGPTLQGIGHSWLCPGTCGSPRAANGHLPSFLLVQHSKDMWKLSLVLYPWIYTLHLCMQLIWSIGDLNFLTEDPFPLCLPYLTCLWPSARERAALGCGRHHDGPAGNSRADGGAALVCAGLCVCNLYYDYAMWYPWCAYALLPETLS